MITISRAIIDAERGHRHAEVEPKDAASLIVLDRSGAEPKVLLGKRHTRHVFMPGKFVFPGGRVDAADSAMPTASPLDDRTQRRLLHDTRFRRAEEACAIALAAIRETFEETGLLIGRPGDAVQAPALWDRFAKVRHLPDPSPLHFIARAITPHGFPRRFDARFFCVDLDCVALQLDGVVHADAELVEIVWLPIEGAMSLDLPLITGFVLRDLQQQLQDGLAASLQVPFYRPRGADFVREEIE